MKERAGLFELLHRNDKQASSSNSGKEKSLPTGADALPCEHVVQLYRIVDSACKALHPDSYPTPKIMEIFLRSVFDDWSIGDTSPLSDNLDRIPLLKPTQVFRGCKPPPPPSLV